jgi:hypothetical protein
MIGGRLRAGTMAKQFLQDAGERFFGREFSVERGKKAYLACRKANNAHNDSSHAVKLLKKFSRSTLIEKSSRKVDRKQGHSSTLLRTQKRSQRRRNWLKGWNDFDEAGYLRELTERKEVEEAD